MASDRMSELFGPSGGAAPKGKKAAGGGGVKAGDVEMQAVSAERAGGGDYTDVFSEIGEIKKMITQINGAAETLLANTQGYKTAPNQKIEAEIKDEVQLTITRTRPVCLKAKDKLKEQKAKLGAAGLDHAEKRMRQQMFRATAKSYIDAVKRYQESQADYESAVRDSASRRLRIVDPHMTDEDIQSCIDEGRAEQVFQKVIREGRKGQLANTYKGVAAQREELLELAKAMNELRDMFQDMAALLELQGENINSIDKNMDSAQDYVDRGIVHLDKATKYQKKKRKQMCCCLLLGLIAAGAIITPILVEALNNA